MKPHRRHSCQIPFSAVWGRQYNYYMWGLQCGLFTQTENIQSQPTNHNQSQPTTTPTNQIHPHAIKHLLLFCRFGGIMAVVMAVKKTSFKASRVFAEHSTYSHRSCFASRLASPSDTRSPTPSWRRSACVPTRTIGVPAAYLRSSLHHFSCTFSNDALFATLKHTRKTLALE